MNVFLTSRSIFTVTLLIFWMASIGNTIFWLLGATMAGTPNHATFRPTFLSPMAETSPSSTAKVANRSILYHSSRWIALIVLHSRRG